MRYFIQENEHGPAKLFIISDNTIVEAAEIQIPSSRPHKMSEEVAASTTRAVSPDRKKVERAPQKSKSNTGEAVAALVAQGNSPSEIAEALGITAAGVHYHISKAKKNAPAEEFKAVATEQDIESIWQWVDWGTREAPEIAKKTGLSEELVREVLMEPRP